LLNLLNDPNEEATVRRSAAEALGKVGQEQLLSILYDADQPLTLRQGAGRALRLMGGEHGAALPVLIVTLHQGQETTQVQPIQVWQEPLGDQLTLDLVNIPGGEFPMGSPPSEEGRDVYPSFYPDTVGKDVEAQHRVTVAPFAMGQFPVTQAQWRSVAALPRVNRELDPDPANFKGDHRPVEQVSWNEAMEFCDRLSQHTGKPYRLPSEAEWEYAARAGTRGESSEDKDGSRLESVAWYSSNSQSSSREVAQKTPNNYGLFDMFGNVWEWVEDCWHTDYSGAPSDSTPWTSACASNSRVLRGGSWFDLPDNLRPTFRSKNHSSMSGGNIGFRLARDL
jgi:formylglycine-generating enzyme required for sulfatase activity